MNAKPGVTWDLLTRSLHWALALALVFNLFILEEGDPPHQWVGYAAVAVVTARFIWGLVARNQASFKSFPVHPRQVFHFIRSGFDSSSFRGHNPLASLTYIAIWLLVLSLGLTGYLMGTDRFWGDEQLEEIHSKLATAIQGLILIHLLGIFVDSARYKRKTWLGMITGRK